MYYQHVPLYSTVAYAVNLARQIQDACHISKSYEIVLNTILPLQAPVLSKVHQDFTMFRGELFMPGEQIYAIRSKF